MYSCCRAGLVHEYRYEEVTPLAPPLSKTLSLGGTKLCVWQPWIYIHVLSSQSIIHSLGRVEHLKVCFGWGYTVQYCVCDGWFKDTHTHARTCPLYTTHTLVVVHRIASPHNAEKHCIKVYRDLGSAKTAVHSTRNNLSMFLSITLQAVGSLHTSFHSTIILDIQTLTSQ